jgi:hypothetical protein
LNGAYDVQVFIRNDDTIPPLLTDKNRFKRIFIHRKSYFITQNMNDEMNDYPFTYDLENKKLILTAEDHSKIILNYQFTENDSILSLSGKIKNISLKIQAKQINTNKLPLLQKQFHWTLDQY